MSEVIEREMLGVKSKEGKRQEFRNLFEQTDPHAVGFTDQGRDKTAPCRAAA
jgi:hypothetical protein